MVHVCKGPHSCFTSARKPPHTRENLVLLQFRPCFLSDCNNTARLLEQHACSKRMRMRCRNRNPRLQSLSGWRRQNGLTAPSSKDVYHRVLQAGSAAQNTPQTPIMWPIMMNSVSAACAICARASHAGLSFEPAPSYIPPPFPRPGSCKICTADLYTP